jgi:hypothetical protein
MDFELRFTDKEITAWAGMGLLKRMLDHMQFDTALSIAGLPQPGSMGLAGLLSNMRAVCLATCCIAQQLTGDC